MEIIMSILTNFLSKRCFVDLVEAETVISGEYVITQLYEFSTSEFWRNAVSSDTLLYFTAYLTPPLTFLGARKKHPAVHCALCSTLHKWV